MKNKMFVLILSVLLISVFSPSVFAQDTVVRIEPSSVTLPPIADLFTVDVVIENGRNVAGCQVWIDYDSSVLHHDETIEWHFKKGDYFSINAFYGKRTIEKLSATKHHLRFAVTPSPFLNSGNGIIATLTFKVLAAKNSSLTLVTGNLSSKTGTLLSDVAGNLTSPRVKGAKVTPAPSRVYTDFYLNTEESVRCIAYSPDGTILAAGGNYNKVYLWDASTGELLYSLPLDGDVYGIAFSPDNKWFASGTDGGTLSLWERNPATHTWSEATTTTNTWENKFPEFKISGIGVNNDVECIAFSPGSPDKPTKMLACGTGGAEVFVWHYNQNNGWKNRQRVSGDNGDKAHGANVKSIAFHPVRSNILMSAGDDGYVRQWDIDTNDPKNKRNIVTVYGDGDNTIYSIAFSKDGRFLAIGKEDVAYISRETKVILLKENETNGVLEIHHHLEPHHPDDPLDYNYAYIDYKHSSSVQSVAFNPSDTVLLSGDNNGIIRVWEVVNTGKEWWWKDPNQEPVISLVTPPPSLLSSTVIYRDKKAEKGKAIADIAFHPHNNTIAIGLFSGAVHQLTCTEHGNVTTSNNSDKVLEMICEESTNINPHTGVGLRLPSNLISEVAHSEHYTYFVLNPYFPRVTGLPNELRKNFIPGKCTITLDTSTSDYFAFPLEPEVDEGIHDVLKKAFNITLGVASFVKSEFFEKLGDALTVLNILVDSVKIIDTAANAVGGSSEEPDFEITIEPKTFSEILIKGLVAYIVDYFVDVEPYQVSPYPTLFQIPDRPSIGIKVEQEYTFKDETSSYKVIYEGTWDLENSTGAAPPARLMAITDYPPFQRIPPEVQKYLLQHFGDFANAEAWQIPETTSLLPNYPNPFNPETWIPYQLAEPADVALTIYDIQGRVVQDLDLGHQRAGVYQSRAQAAHWDGRNAHGEPVASGIYFYTLKAGDFTATRKMLIRK